MSVMTSSLAAMTSSAFEMSASGIFARMSLKRGASTELFT